MARFGRPAAQEDLERVDALRAEIVESARMFHLDSAIVAAIVSRETRGHPKFFVGDGGHGCGPMQVDDRTRPELCARYKAGDVPNAAMISAGCEILREKIEALRRNAHLQDQQDLLKAAVAAYNCGQGNVARALEAGASVDRFTTGENYSWDVVQRATLFREHGYV
jgi:hypothetical protein